MSSAAPTAPGLPAGKLGLIAGGGDLPVRLIEAARAQGREIYVLAIDKQADLSESVLAGVAYDSVGIGKVGKMLDLLRANGVRDLIFAGRVKRPSLVALMPDGRGAKFMAKIAGKALGDDGLLRAVVAELEGEGFRVLGPETLLGELLMPDGVLGRVQPDETAWTDIRHGLAIARGIGALDIGQAAVVQQGLVLGVEAIEGTDALLMRCADLKREGAGRRVGEGQEAGSGAPRRSTDHRPADRRDCRQSRLAWHRRRGRASAATRPRRRYRRRRPARAVHCGRRPSWLRRRCAFF